MKKNTIIAIAAVALLGIVVGSSAAYYYLGGIAPSPLKKVKLLLQYDASGEDALGFYVALDKGWYKEAGLDVEIIAGQGTGYAAQMVIAGQVDIGVVSAVEVLVSQAKNLDLEAVWWHLRNPIGWYALPESGIKTPYNWVGRKVGCQYGAFTYSAMQIMLTKLGIDPTKLEEISMGWDNTTPLITNMVDVTVGYVNNKAEFVYGLDIPDIVEMRAVDWGVNIMANMLAVTSAYKESNYDTLKKFIEVTSRAWKYTYIDHLEETVDEIWATRFPEINATSNREVVLKKFQAIVDVMPWENFALNGWGSMPAELWNENQDLLFSTGSLEKKVDTSQVYTNEFSIPWGEES